MTDAPFTDEDYLTAVDLLREAVEANLAEEDNLGLVRAYFDRGVAMAWSEGSFVASVERLVSDHLWARVNAKAGRTTHSMLSEVAAGQTCLSVDEWLDQVITVGKLRRTTIRNINREDLARIIEVREENARQAQESLEQAEQAVARLDAALVSASSVPQALAVGALHMQSIADQDAVDRRSA